jgi:hypothetical protein
MKFFWEMHHFLLPASIQCGSHSIKVGRTASPKIHSKALLRYATSDHCYQEGVSCCHNDILFNDDEIVEIVGLLKNMY